MVPGRITITFNEDYIVLEGLEGYEDVNVLKGIKAALDRRIKDLEKKSENSILHKYKVGDWVCYIHDLDNNIFRPMQVQEVKKLETKDGEIRSFYIISSPATWIEHRKMPEEWLVPVSVGQARAIEFYEHKISKIQDLEKTLPDATNIKFPDLNDIVYYKTDAEYGKVRPWYVTCVTIYRNAQRDKREYSITDDLTTRAIVRDVSIEKLCNLGEAIELALKHNRYWIHQIKNFDKCLTFSEIYLFNESQE